MSRNLRAELLATGDELLTGAIADTNGALAALRLRDAGTRAPEVPSGTYGFDLYARQAIRGGNREALEQLARHIPRPPPAQARLAR